MIWSEIGISLWSEQLSAIQTEEVKFTVVMPKVIDDQDVTEPTTDPIIEKSKVK